MTNESTQIIELSISKNYVCTWGFWEAMREIFQNAIDSDADGNEMNIQLTSDNETISIFNEGVFLPINSLVLGNSDKGTTHIGKFGEGYKLALVVLLRMGYKVSIHVGEQRWIPYFDYSDTLQTEVLKIKIIDGNDFNTDGTTFMIGGLTYSNIEELKVKCLPFRHKYTNGYDKKIESEYGDILMSDQLKGKFYVEGLFIQDDTSFTYGYSFKKDYVDLDRDRRAINYYDLLELTANSLLSQSEDVTIVETCITNKAKDIKELADFNDAKISQDFAIGYAKHFFDKHDLDEDTFVGTEKETMVSGSAKTFVTDKIQAKIVNIGLNKLDEYQETQRLAEKKNNRDLAFEYYERSVLCQLHQWLTANAKRLSNKQINNFLDIIEEIKPSNYNLIEKDVKDNVNTALVAFTDGRYKERDK